MHHEVPKSNLVTTDRSPDIPYTDKERDDVANMSRLGLPESQIATYFGITIETLHENFADQLGRPAADANVKVLEALYDLATSGKFTSATIFWARSRCGFNPNPSSHPLLRPSYLRQPKPEPPTILPQLTVHLNDGEPNLNG